MGLLLRVEQDCLSDKIFKFNDLEQSFGFDSLGIAGSEPVKEHFTVISLYNRYYVKVAESQKFFLVTAELKIKSKDCSWTFFEISPKAENENSEEPPKFNLNIRFGFLGREYLLHRGREYLLGSSKEADISVDLPEIPSKYLLLKPSKKTISIKLLQGEIKVGDRKVLRSTRIGPCDSIKLMPLGLKVNFSNC